MDGKLLNMSGPEREVNKHGTGGGLQLLLLCRQLNVIFKVFPHLCKLFLTINPGGSLYIIIMNLVHDHTYSYTCLWPEISAS